MAVPDGAQLARLGAAVQRSYWRANLLVVLLIVFCALYLAMDSPRPYWVLLVLHVLCFLVAMMLPLMWLSWNRTAYAALAHMGSGQKKYTGVVGSWARMLMLNLARPYRMMKDLWVRSAQGNTGDADGAAAPRPLIAWWVACLFPLLLAALRAIAEDLEGNDNLLAEAEPVLLYWFPVVATGLAIFVVARIQNLQLVQAHRTERIGLRSRSVLALAGVAALGLAALAVPYVQTEWTTATPEASFEALRAAYLQKDLPTFRRYCDTDSVLRRDVERLRNSGALQSAAGSLPPLPSLIATIVGVKMNQNYEENHADFAAQLEQMYVSGQQSMFMDGSWLPGGGGPWGRVGTAMNGFFTAGAENLRKQIKEEYRGIVDSKMGDGAAHLQVAFEAPENGKIERTVYTVRLERALLHWRVMAIENRQITVK